MSEAKTISEIKTALQDALEGEVVIGEMLEVRQPWLEIAPERIADVGLYLRDTSGLHFDYLECLSGMDYGPKEGSLGVVYHLMSIPYGHRLVLKVKVPREIEGGEPSQLPAIPTVSEIWKTAEWHEREAYDLVGILFTDHPDMRRILMPADWPGHPLRKDYENPDTYHGIKTAY